MIKVQLAREIRKTNGISCAIALHIIHRATQRSFPENSNNFWFRSMVYGSIHVLLRHCQAVLRHAVARNILPRRQGLYRLSSWLTTNTRNLPCKQIARKSARSQAGRFITDLLPVPCCPTRPRFYDTRNALRIHAAYAEKWILIIISCKSKQI